MFRRSLLRDKQWQDADRAVNCILQAAQGLANAHEQGIVHRDVKPSNLLLDRSGTVKVLDLGLARSTSIALDDGSRASDDLTASGQVMGTIDYIAPEQAIDSRNADERSDIYSLGCTLFSLLHGRPVYARESVVNRLLAHQSDRIPSLSDGRSDVSEALNAVFFKMVCKDPEKRYQTMRQVIEELQAIQCNKTNDRASRVAGRFWPVAVGPTFVVALLLLIGAVARRGAKPFAERGRGKESELLSATEKETTHSSRPPPAAIVPFDLRAAKAHQQAWAEYLGVPIEFTSSVGMNFRLIPPGEFVMGTSQDVIASRLQFPNHPDWRSNAAHEFPRTVCCSRVRIIWRSTKSPRANIPPAASEDRAILRPPAEAKIGLPVFGRRISPSRV